MYKRFRIIAAIALVVSMFPMAVSGASHGDEPAPVDYQDFATDEFERVWERTDYPVQQTEVARTWIWGPGANTELLQEDYKEAEDGYRDVQYTDKSRMEMPWNDVDPDSEWAITQGRLAYELMTGKVQLGDDFYVGAFPAEIPAAGDPDSESSPTYAAMGDLMDRDARAGGDYITETVDRYGNVDENTDLADYGVTDDYLDDVTGHHIASVFWDFMQSTGTIYEDGEYQFDEPLFENPFYAVGRPITDAFWGWVKVDNVEQNVLIQCFERRCLTFTPGNPDGWEVESGNIGQHYYEWRYNQVGDPKLPDEKPFFIIEPEDATNAFIEGEDNEHTVQAHFREGDADGGHLDMPGAEFEVTIEDADGNAITPDEIDVNEEEGRAHITYTGAMIGTDTISATATVDGVEYTAETTKTWAEPYFVVEPEDATNAFIEGEDNEHTVQAHFRQNDADGGHLDMPGAEFEVTIEDADGNAITPDEIDVNEEEGRAHITYTGTMIGTDTISATATVDGVEYTAETTKTWAEPYFVVEPEDAANAFIEGEDNEHTVQAHFRQNDADGGHLDMPGAEFEVTIEDEDGTAITPDEIDVNEEEGRAHITYTGTMIGTDTISATATVDGVEYTAETTKTWESDY